MATSLAKVNLSDMSVFMTCLFFSLIFFCKRGYQVQDEKYKVQNTNTNKSTNYSKKNLYDIKSFANRAVSNAGLEMQAEKLGSCRDNVFTVQ